MDIGFTYWKGRISHVAVSTLRLARSLFLWQRLSNKQNGCLSAWHQRQVGLLVQ
ncbi:hypothetical protein J6590_030173 [Homalodisca vitripennis]|nr:hypothetical protein J6590_030173 [Homalodisca vitripennis]